MKMSQFGYLVIALFTTCASINASHFRGAIFTWTSADDGSTITIRYRISWRTTYSSNHLCDDSTISTGTIVNGEGSLICYSGCSDTIGSLPYQCTDFSTIDDWTSGRYELTYSVSATTFSFRFSRCCWISTLQVGADGGWSVLTTVDLSIRSDTGRINSSPTAEMTPVLNLQDGCSYNVIIPVGDVDGDIVKCRWAADTAECGDVCNGFTGAILDEEACAISYTPNGNQGLYAAALQIEDFASTISTIPFSSIPLQFILKVYDGSGFGCDEVPEFIYPSPNDSSCFALDVGDNFNVTIRAKGTQIFNRITTISAVGMMRSTEAKSQDSTWHYIELNVTWTPTAADAGQDHSLCFYATDNTGLTSQTRCINLPVSVSGPTPLRVERVGLANTWIIIIDQTFTRPTEPAYINVYESSTNSELLSVDASTSSDVVFDPINRRISVSFEYNFDIEEDYYVTIPSGLVEGFVSCGALSVPVDDSGFWNIEIDCGELNILNGVVIAPNGTDYPHSVTYVCNIGHDLVGISNRTCTANGTWTGSEPFCNPRDCGNFTIPDNGSVSTTSTIYDTTVIFYCDEGYEVTGNSSMYCAHTAVWSASPPLCILVDCGNPPQLAHGNVSTPDGTTFQKAAIYTCSLGYDLIGNSTRICQQDKQWSSTQQHCSMKDCGLLSPPSNGIIGIVNTTVGATVTYSCDVGFSLDGDYLRQCLNSGVWNGTDPTCAVTDCGQLINPSNGNVIDNGSIYRSVGIFSCEQGYRLYGSNISECQANGSWSSPEPSCLLVECGALSPLLDGVYSYNKTTYGENLTAVCNEGYELRGSNIRQCLESGDWSGTETTCTIKDCGPLSKPMDGSVSVIATFYGSEATYSCETGYNMSGGATTICQADGSWSEQPPTCHIKDCGPLRAPDNGSIYLPQTTYGSYALYICDEEYHIEGSNNRRCVSNGNWSDEEPVCALTDCGNLTAPMFGDVTFNSTLYNDVAIFKCNTGYELVGDAVIICQSDNTWSDTNHVCVIKVCGFLQAPENGETKATAATYQTIETFTCNEGFDLVGNDTLVCTADGVWNGSAPTCEIKDCGYLSPPENGYIFVNETTVNSNASYVCYEGFTLDGNDNRTCLSNGTWSESAPSCLIKDCGAPLPPKNGKVHFNSTVYSSECFFSCIPGYDFEGVNSSVCSESGVWNNTHTECIIKDCGNLTVPYNGRIDVNDTTFGSTAILSCLPGYTLQGYANRTCTEFGCWDNDYSECVIKDCGNLTNPDDGIVSYSSTTYLSIANYSCTHGFNLVGLNATYCTAAGVWSSVMPTCQIIDCGPLPAPDNGNNDVVITTYGQTVNFTCDLGYDIIGDFERTCLETGFWSGTQTTCTLTDCGMLTAPTDGLMEISGTEYMSTAVYKCNNGYDLNGVSARQCLANGSWSYVSPTCLIKDCGMLNDVANGYVYIPLTTFESVASYICDKGYHVVGDVTRVCQADSTWDGAEPFCELTVCPEMPAPENGQVEHNSTLFEDEMIFSCNPGYTLFGNEVVVCQKDGTWTDSGHNCTIKDCGTLQVLKNGIINFVSTTYLSTADFQCNEGYYLIGETSIGCDVDGHWNGTIPKCNIYECENLDSPLNGNVFFNATTYGSLAIYSCYIGYEIIGDAVRVCQNNTWSSHEPECRIKDCGKPPVLVNGDTDFENTSYGSVSVYSCDIGYDMEGENISNCDEDGRWNNIDIACIIKDCGNLTTPENANVYVNNSLYGSTAVFSCNTGFTLHGNVTRTCLETGIWSSDYPSCYIKDCGVLNGIANGRINLTATTYGAVASYICDDGYQMIGNVSRICQADGTWVGEKPFCELIVCPEVTAPANGNVYVNSTLFEDEVIFSCDPGYTLQGQRTIICQKDGTWSDDGHICEINDCGNLSNPGNGFASYNESTYGSVAVYQCDNGYILKGNQRTECSADGNWTSVQPICEITDCGLLISPQNGRIDIENTTFGSNVTVTCDVGYDMIGDSRRRCLASGHWSGTLTECLIKDCGFLAIPLNGNVSVSSTEYGATAAYICELGYELVGNQYRECLASGAWSDMPPACRIKDCGTLSDPANGVVYAPITTYGSYALYICNEGYHVEGGVTRLCMANAIWSNAKPLCQQTDCGDISSPDGGQVDYNNTVYGSHAIFNCNAGHDLVGDKYIFCRQDGTWSGIGQYCKIKDCGTIKTPTNGTLSSLATTYNSVATFACEDGFDLVGSSVLKCQSTGYWNNSEPTCQIKFCGNLSSPANGTVYVNALSFGSTAEYNCDEGFDLIGAIVRTCQNDQRWSSSRPICAIKDCGLPPTPNNSKVHFDSTEFGSIASYTCKTGYFLDGENTSVCTQYGNWSNSNRNNCEIKDCGQLKDIENGNINLESTKYNAAAYFNCNDGYTIEGSAERRCLPNGTWSNSNPTCNIDDCGEPEAPIHGFISVSSTTYGSSVNYSCENGYDLDGHRTRECNADGVWSNEDPECVIADCDALTYPTNGRIIAKSRHFGDTAVYICDPGYTLIGDDTRGCLANKSWSNTEPSCGIKDCGELSDLEHGKIIYDTTTYGSKVAVACDEGYDLVGETPGTCEHTGTWSLNISECRIKDCGNLKDPENGLLEVNNTVYNSVATVRCDVGYTPDIEYIYCTYSGSWESTPKCSIVDCGNTEAPGNGLVLFSNTTYSSVAVFKCEAGYDLIGVSNKTCGLDGTWSNGATTCNIKNCIHPNTPYKGRMDLSSTEYRAIVTFTCDAGYDLVGSAALRCLENGTWSDMEPSCEIKDCGDPLPISNGQLQYNTTTFGSNASYTCRTGYNITVRAIIECRKDGTWENRPQCTIRDCGELASPQNGMVVTSSSTYGSLAIFSCNAGYNLVGSQLSECLESATWSNVDIACEIKDCGTPLMPMNGNVSYDSTTYESDARYYCHADYKIKGEGILTCNTDGMWNGTVPDCIITGCDDLEAPPNGGISISAITYGAVAVFDCNPGYDLVGENYLECTENGTWDGDTPECKIKDCGKLADPDGGKIIQTETVVGAVSLFRCNEGYTMTGPETINCTYNGTWNMDPPVCSKAASSAAMYALIGGSVVGVLLFLITVSLATVEVVRRMKRSKAPKRPGRMSDVEIPMWNYNGNRTNGRQT